jgi:hypothetical protein
VIPLEQRPGPLERHDQRDENDEGQVDQLVAVMRLDEQHHPDGELARVGQQRDGQHDQAAAHVQPPLQPDG